MFLILLLLVFFGMGHTLIGCSLGPLPDNGNSTATDGSGQQFHDSPAMVAPILLCMLLTVWLGIDTPEFLEQWIEQALEFLQREPLS